MPQPHRPPRSAWPTVGGRFRAAPRGAGNAYRRGPRGKLQAFPRRQIKRFLIVGTPWEPGGDELTPTMKLKRRPIAEKYSAEIDKLYAEIPGPDVINLSNPD